MNLNLEKTNIFVEGFVRSGTTFSSLLISKSYANYKIVPKSHQTSAIDYCIKNNIPCFVLVRDPVESISSWIYFEHKNIINDKEIIDILKWNNRYMEFIYNNKEKIFISDINDFSLNHFNILKKFSKKYNLDDPVYIDNKDIIKEINFNEKNNGHRQATPSNNYEEKNIAKKIILDEKFKEYLKKSIFYYQNSMNFFIN